MNKFGPKATQEIRKAVHEYKRGVLKSGPDGDNVRSNKQAVAIGISKARKKGYKVPDKSKEATNEK